MGYPYDKTYLEKIQENEHECKEIEDDIIYGVKENGEDNGTHQD